jgi:hypothetical protein
VKSKFHGASWAILDARDKEAKAARLIELEDRLREVCSDPCRRERLVGMVGEVHLKRFSDGNPANAESKTKND